MAQILVVEDELNLLKMTQLLLKKNGHEVCCFSSGAAAIAHIESEARDSRGMKYDIVLTDYRLNDVTGMDVLHAVKRIDESTQVLLITAYATTQTAVEAMRFGAFDYIEKPYKIDQLISLIDKAIARRDIMRSQRDDSKSPDLLNVIGDSPAMKDVLDLVARVAPSKANILITGESGTGKEVIARAIHQLSGIKGPFIPVNCGAIPETLVESEFFGYAKGAFTGASRDKEGYFAAAKGGSLFLDEIGELPLAMQVKLLRAIQEKKIQPVGSTAEIPVSVRIIAATNRDLRTEVEEHRFREDLFFRLNVFQISIPALRDRRSDIPCLIHHFLQKYNEELGKKISGVSEEALSVLMEYDYRGNVRELENILEHAATLEMGDKLAYSSLPAYLRHEHSGEHPIYDSSAGWPASSRIVHFGQDGEYDSSENNPAVQNEKMIGLQEMMQNVSLGDGVELEGIVEDLERKLIEQSLSKTDGNKTEAAKLLGISFRSMCYRLKKYGFK